MSRLLKRDSGEVLVDGKDILKWDNKELAKTSPESLFKSLLMIERRVLLPAPFGPMKEVIFPS